MGQVAQGWVTSVTAAEQEVRPSRHLIVSERLRVRRHQLGLTQKQVITRLGSLGVRSTNKALSSLEHGAGLDVGKLPELAEALDCTVTWLLGLTGDPHKWEPDRFLRPAATPRADRSPQEPDPAPDAEDGEPHQAGSWILGPLSPDP